MKFKFLKLRNMIMRELLLREADEKSEKPNEKSAKDKNADDFKKRADEWAATFYCPRHKLPLEPIWGRALVSDEKDPAAKKAKAAEIQKQYKGVQPASKERPDLLPSSTKQRSVQIIKWLVCPLMQKDADKSEINYVTVNGEKKAAIYSVWRNEKNEDGEFVRVEKSVECDYRVTPRTQYPGQKVPNVAVGYVAMEEGFAEYTPGAAPHGSVPAPRSDKVRSMIRQKDVDPDELIDALNTSTFKTLFDKISDMNQKGYHFKKVNSNDALMALNKLIKTKGIKGVKSIGAQNDETDNEYIEVESDKSADELGIPSTIGGYSVRVVDKASKRPVADPTSADYKKNKAKGRDKWVKISLQYKNDSYGNRMPLFTGDDVQYLSYHYPNQLFTLKNDAGENYAGPRPYRIKADDVQALLFKLGWDMPDNTTNRKITLPSMPTKEPGFMGQKTSTTIRRSASTGDEFEAKPAHFADFDDGLESDSDEERKHIEKKIAAAKLAVKSAETPQARRNAEALLKKAQQELDDLIELDRLEKNREQTVKWRNSKIARDAAIEAGEIDDDDDLDDDDFESGERRLRNFIKNDD